MFRVRGGGQIDLLRHLRKVLSRGVHRRDGGKFSSLSLLFSLTDFLLLTFSRSQEELKEDPWSCPTCVDSNLQWVEGKPSKKTKACSRSDERVINGEEREELVHKFRKDFLRIKDLAVVMSEIMKTQEHFNSLQTRHMIKRGQVS